MADTVGIELSDSRFSIVKSKVFADFYFSRFEYYGYWLIYEDET